jgi:hypothetical protein
MLNKLKTRQILKFTHSQSGKTSGPARFIFRSQKQLAFEKQTHTHTHTQESENKGAYMCDFFILFSVCYGIQNPQHGFPFLIPYYMPLLLKGKVKLPNSNSKHQA